MAPAEKLSTQQIGKLGELLVQYRLLSLGIDSAPLTIDDGIDLVAYSRDRKSAKTIQVKTNLKPKPGGGKGKPALDWWVPENSPAISSLSSIYQRSASGYLPPSKLKLLRNNVQKVGCIFICIPT